MISVLCWHAIWEQSFGWPMHRPICLNFWFWSFKESMLGHRLNFVSVPSYPTFFFFFSSHHRFRIWDSWTKWCPSESHRLIQRWLNWPGKGTSALDFSFIAQFLIAWWFSYGFLRLKNLNHHFRQVRFRTIFRGLRTQHVLSKAGRSKFPIIP